MENRMFRKMAGLVPVFVSALTASTLAQSKEVLFTETFENNSAYTDSGLVRSTAEGVRLLGGWWLDGTILLEPVNIEGYTDLELVYDRTVNRLDNSEHGSASYTVDGATFTPLETVTTGSGSATLALDGIPPEATSIQLKFAIEASNAFESFTIANVELRGVPVGEEPDPEEPTDPTDPDDPADPGDPSDPGDPADPGDPKDPGEPTDPDQPDVTAGEEQYLTQCAGCHGATADGNPIGVPLDMPMDYGTAISAIVATMPPRNPESCGSDCATDIVDYLKVTYWGDSTGDPGDGSGGENPGDEEPEGPLLGEGAEPVGKCEDPINLEGSVVSNGLGFNLTNTRNAPSVINSGNVADLAFEHAYVAPGVETRRGAPTVTDHAVFFYANNTVYATDRETGCNHWTYTGDVEAPMRSSSVMFVPGTETLFVGDFKGYVHAINARTGEQRWKTFAGDDTFGESGHMLTGGMQYHNGKLIVPVSSIEVFQPLNDPCCSNHGTVRALDAVSGDNLWTYHTTEPAVNYGEYQGPSGAPVWSTPTIDPERNLVLFGTGQNYSEPATHTSDAVIAVDLDTGEERWVFQAREDDVWNNHAPGVQNGKDFDFGASPILLDDGSAVIAGDKAGIVYSLDPDSGTVNWARQLGIGSKLGGVHWNMAVDDEKVYVGIADKSPEPVDPESELDASERPGVYALDLGTGEVVWSAHPTHTFEGETVNSAYSASIAVTNDLVFAGSLDGVLRAFHKDDGTELWSFDTAVGVVGVDGERGHGGTVDSAGPVIADDTVLLNSGYAVFGGATRYQGGAGNALFVLKLRQ